MESRIPFLSPSYLLVPYSILTFAIYYFFGTERAEDLERKVDELEEVVAELQSKMGQQEEGAKEAISQWEARCNILEENLSAAEDARDEAEASLEPLEGQLDKIKDQSEDVVKKWQGECKANLFRKSSSLNLLFHFNRY